MRLYIGNLPFKAKAEDLANFFAEKGYEVTEPKVITDKETGRSRGFGFVDVADNKTGSEIIATVNGDKFWNRQLIIREAQERKAK